MKDLLKDLDADKKVQKKIPSTRKEKENVETGDKNSDSLKQRLDKVGDFFFLQLRRKKIENKNKKDFKRLLAQIKDDLFLENKELPLVLSKLPELGKTRKESETRMLKAANKKVLPLVLSRSEVPSESELDKEAGKINPGDPLRIKRTKKVLTKVKSGGFGRLPINQIKISLASPEQIKKWCSRTLPNGVNVGEIKNAQTIHYKTYRPIDNGLFCQRIFGPIDDFTCACGIKKNFEDLPSVGKEKFCSKCNVEFTLKRVRRYHLGYIKLHSPVTHIWFLKGRVSYISILLDYKRKHLEEVTFCQKIVQFLKNNTKKNFFFSPTFFKEIPTYLRKSDTFLSMKKKRTKEVPPDRKKKKEPDAKQKKKKQSFFLEKKIASEKTYLFEGSDLYVNLYKNKRYERVVSTFPKGLLSSQTSRVYHCLFKGVESSETEAPFTTKKDSFLLFFLLFFFSKKSERTKKNKLKKKKESGLFFFPLPGRRGAEGIHPKPADPKKRSKCFPASGKGYESFYYTLFDKIKRKKYVGEKNRKSKDDYIYKVSEPDLLEKGGYQNWRRRNDIGLQKKLVNFLIKSKVDQTSRKYRRKLKPIALLAKGSATILFFPFDIFYRFPKNLCFASTLNPSFISNINEKEGSTFNKIGLKNKNVTISKPSSISEKEGYSKAVKTFLQPAVCPYLPTIVSQKFDFRHGKIPLFYFNNYDQPVPVWHDLLIRIFLTGSPKKGDIPIPEYSQLTEYPNPFQLIFEHDSLLEPLAFHNKHLANTGGSAIKKMLNKLNLPLLANILREILLKVEKDMIKLLRKPKKRPRDIRKMKRLKNYKFKKVRCAKITRDLINSKVRPEWMTLSTIPVIPPDLRPILKLDGDRLAISDLNNIYQSIIYRNARFTNQFKLNSLNLQSLLQKAVDALLDNGKGGNQSMCASNGRPFKSLSDLLKGKTGRFRQNLLGKRVDYSGRSVIIVGPYLKLYQCGLPKEMAIELFHGFLIRDLIIHKIVKTSIEAKQFIEKKDLTLWVMLEKVMQKHLVLLNRAPTLHRLGIQAFQPKLVNGRAILLHPLVCTAFNADFDGDQMAVHIPLSKRAQAESRVLMWSINNIISPATGQPILVPSQDMILGCNYLTYLNEELNKNKNLPLPKKNKRPFIIKNEREQRQTKKNTNKKSNQGIQSFFSISSQKEYEYEERCFSSLNDLLSAYHQNQIFLHAPVWVKTNLSLETENTTLSPLETRINRYGEYTEIFFNFQEGYDKNGRKMRQYLRTTPGRVLVNQVLFG